MSQLRNDILDWAATGRLKPGDVVRALEIAGLTPTPAAWRKFLQSLLLWTGVVLCASGVIFFFAYNWRTLPKPAKFAIAEFLLASTVGVAWKLGIDKPVGKAALTGACLLTGALLALAGEIYQTGADAYELFGLWALLILPWVGVACFVPLWLFWMFLLNIATWTYFAATRWNMFGFLSGFSGTLWAHFALNLIALATFEAGLAARTAWLNRWAARAPGVLAGGFITALGVFSITGVEPFESWAILVYLAWAAAMYVYYRHFTLDVFMLSGGALSLIVVITAFCARRMLEKGDAAAPLLVIGVLVIGMSAAAGWWIRQLVKEEQPLSS